MLDFRRFEARPGRLPHSRAVFRLRAGHRLDGERKVSTSGDFLTSGRSVPVWITSLAFLAANLGAQEVIGMCASGAKYGIMTAHFYWMGAVPAMLFVGVFMMPFYYGSRARSVPEYLKLRFDEKTRALNAVTFAVMTIFSSGISMYALGLLFQLVLGWSFTASVLLLGGASCWSTRFWAGSTSAIYNEVLQFFLIVLGFAPLAILAVMKAGGWSGMAARMSAGDDAHLALYGQARRIIRWAWRYSAWSRGWDSCCRSDTGAPIFWWCSAPWRRIPCRPRGARR